MRRGANVRNDFVSGPGAVPGCYGSRIVDTSLCRWRDGLKRGIAAKQRHRGLAVEQGRVRYGQARVKASPWRAWCPVPGM
jgi:hypothetical protein